MSQNSLLEKTATWAERLLNKRGGSWFAHSRKGAASRVRSFAGRSWPFLEKVCHWFVFVVALLGEGQPGSEIRRMSRTESFSDKQDCVHIKSGSLEPTLIANSERLEPL